MSSSSSSTAVPKPQPFKIQVPEQQLDRLSRLLSDVDLPDEDIVTDVQPNEYALGTNLAKLKELISLWSSGTPTDADGKISGGGKGQGVKAWWRSIEERLNAYPQFQIELEGVKLHYLHARSPHADAIPLIFTHGWPGSFYEVYHIIPYLLEKDPKTGVAFHVVAPSLPGYGWSNAQPVPKGWAMKDTARIFGTLMTDVLGFKSWMAQGGDWGSLCTRYLSLQPECKIFHTNFLPPTKPPKYALPLLGIDKLGYRGVFNAVTARLMTAFEYLGVQRGLEYQKVSSGYVAIQATKPATLGYALYGHPVGIASWFLEKFKVWTDPRSPAFAKAEGVEPLTRFSDETMLVNISIYYLTNTIHTSFMPYHTDFDGWTSAHLFKAAQNKPYGHSAYKYELARGPRAWLANQYLNNVFYKEKEVGGHFAAWEDPEGLAGDLAEFASKYYPKA